MSEETNQGAFLESLVRNNKKIRQDRAEAIGEDAQIRYKREVEDLEIKIRQLNRERESMLDMSPENAMSLVLASDFDSKAFVEKDIAMGVEMRNLQIKLEIASERFAHLFGG